MEKEDVYGSLMEGADQPEHVYHRFYLRQNLRKMRNVISSKNLQKFKYELTQNVNDTRKSAEFVENTMESLMERIVEKTPMTLECVSSLIATSNGDAPQTVPNYCDSILNSELKSGVNPTTDLLNIIELLGKLFNVTGDEKFFQEHDQLVEILSMMKNYELSDETLKNLYSKYHNLSASKEQLIELLRGEVIPSVKKE